MQIRIANRQDEKKIIAFVEEIFGEQGRKLDLSSADLDLKNVEANYFGKDGVFLVAEEEQKVVGIAGANMIDLDTCELRRIYVAKDFRRRGIGRKMLSIIVSIAKRLDYKRLVVGDTPRDGTSPSLPEFRATTEKFFECLGFSIPSSKTNISLVQLQLAL